MSVNRKPKASRHARGYGTAHEYRRKAIEPAVITGKTVCCRCGEPIKPSDEWHLDHSDDRRGYLGVAHKLCNLRAAGLKQQELRREQERRGYKDGYKNWSRVWFEPVPPGMHIRGVPYEDNGEAEIA
jgi:hypothetical protein